MIILSSKYSNLFPLIAGPLLFGVCTYFVLSVLMLPIRISIPLSVIMSFLIFGLAKYYYCDIYYNNLKSTKTREKISSNSYDRYKNNTHFSIFFFGGNVLCLCILFFSPGPNTSIFIPWQNFTLAQLIQVGASVAISFFLPGYFLLRLLDRNNQLEVIPGVLVSYFFSVLITGLTGIAAVSSGLPLSDIKLVLLCINSLVLMVWFIIWIKGPLNNNKNRKSISYILKLGAIKAKNIVRQNTPAAIVFCSLFSLIVLSSYFLYSGTIIGDQWNHHGRALLFISGGFRDLTNSGLDGSYPPFFSSLLAAFFSMTGTPSVNSYVSINFLNIIPVIAFYYFFTKWVPIRYRPASLIACSLFMLASGFGWMHVLDLAFSSPATSSLSALEILHSGGIKTFDIRMPSTFINSAHPEITTGLIIIALPAGFVLLGLIKENRMSNKLRYLTILMAISILSILTHDEFYLFVIIASISPLIFRLGGNTNVLFGSLLFSLSIVIFIDFVLPIDYYTNREILGFPLIGLVFLFVSLMWALDISRVLSKIYSIYISKLRNEGSSRSFTRLFQRTNLRLALGITIVSVFVYFYIFTFMVWSQLSLQDVQIQTANLGQRIVPWYLYPMKLGLIGLLGFAFIMSYIFKRFEKELLIFGIIGIIAFLTGPYYNEHRFIKYIMIGMVGYASILIYKVLGFALHKIRFRSLICSMLIGAIIISSSLSSIMFTAYTALGLENPTYRPFNVGLNQRHFPSPSEFHFLDYVYNNLTSPKTYNLALLADEQSRDQGIDSKISSFSDMPYAKLRQSPLTLNSSTLEGFYDQLDYTDTRYIVIPNDGINDIQKDPLTPINFALESFPIVYHDSNYTLLSVPSLSPPSSSEDGNLALIYQKIDPKFQSPSETKILSYNKEPFSIDKKSDFLNLENKNHNQSTLVLHGEKPGGITLWSNPISEKEDINYLESKFRIISDNQSKDDAGLKFRDENNEYYIVLRQNSLDVEQRTIDHPRKSQILFRHHMTHENNVWHDLKVAITNQTIVVYLDDFARAQAVINSGDKISVSEVGVRSYRNSAEFQPIIIGHISDTEANKKQLYYSHYYPLSALALSKIKYSTFSEGDLSALSKRSIILPYDPPAINGTAYDNYLEYVNKGGTLIVLNTYNDFSGIFGQLLAVQANGAQSNGTKSISEDNTSLPPSARRNLQSTNLSSITKESNFDSSHPLSSASSSLSSNKTVKSFYINNYNQKVSPFVIEKSFGQGKIVFVNAGPYFQSIFKDPESSFATLRNIPSLLNINAEKYNASNHISEIPPTRLVGGLKAFGATVINGSSILLLTGEPFTGSSNISGNFYAEQIKVSPVRNEQIGIGNSGQVKVPKGTLENVFIKDLKVMGKYQVAVNSTGFSYQPSIHDSYYDYAGINITSPFDMIIKLAKGSSAELEVQQNGTSYYQIKIHSNNNTNTEIHFDGIKYTSPHIPRLAPIIIKEPEIRVINGNASFSQLYSRNPEDLTKGWANGQELQVEGDIKIKLDHVDYYDERNGGIIERQPLTYLNWIKIDGNTTLDESALKIPGDISAIAKISRSQVPWQEVIYSENNILLILSIVVVASIVWYLSAKKIKTLFKQ